jgi:hypothetical protein
MFANGIFDEQKNLKVCNAIQSNKNISKSKNSKNPNKIQKKNKISKTNKNIF